MGLIKNWRRRRALKNQSIDEDLWRRVLAGLPFLRGLSSAELGELRELALLFLAEKEMHGAGGLELSDDICLSIALQACLPILKLGLDAYAGWVGVVVYPAEFLVRREEMDEDGVMHEYEEELSGEAWEGGPVVLSWQDVKLTSAGYNVVIHEFAHKLDMENGNADGFPVPRNGLDPERWQEVWQLAYDGFCREVDAGRETLVDPYAAEHPAEFFAVMSEMFFTHSEVLARDWPGLYEQLAGYYRQDPAERLHDAGVAPTSP
jgi:Mlc titration factor MtfA (ptsG expression regulator)